MKPPATVLLPLAALGLVHVLAVALAPSLLLTSDPGHVIRALPALTSILALAAGASAAWAPGWRLSSKLPAAELLAAACWCASSTFARPVLVAVFRPAEAWIDGAALVYRVLVVVLGVALLLLLAFAGGRWLWSRRWRVASWAILGALAIGCGFAGWALWPYMPPLATWSLPILCAFFIAIIWRGGWPRRYGVVIGEDPEGRYPPRIYFTQPWEKRQPGRLR